jgi:hypothetical protein
MIAITVILFLTTGLLAIYYFFKINSELVIAGDVTVGSSVSELKSKPSVFSIYCVNGKLLNSLKYRPLVVSGESMGELGIHSNDIVFIRVMTPQEKMTLRPGDVVVLRVDEPEVKAHRMLKLREFGHIIDDTLIQTYSYPKPGHRKECRPHKMSNLIGVVEYIKSRSEDNSHSLQMTTAATVAL